MNRLPVIATLLVVCVSWACGSTTDSPDGVGPDVPGDSIPPVDAIDAALDVAADTGDAADDIDDVFQGNDPGDSAGPGDIPGEFFLPDVPLGPAFHQTGLIVPADSIGCVDDDGNPSEDCNHHGSSVWVTADGTVIAVWYHGKGEKSKDSAVLWAKRPAGGDWQDWEVLYDLPDHAEGNPVFWVNDRTGVWHLFFITLFGPTWNDGQIRMITSSDEGANWSDVTVLREEHHWMIRNKPIRMSNGEVLLPCYDESLYTPTFMVSGDDFQTSGDQIDMGENLLLTVNQIQPTVLERTDRTLVALMRNSNSYVPQYAWEMTSTDFGRTWSEPSASPIPNGNHSNEMIRLRSGRWAIAFNNSLGSRYPLSVALSEDEGLTWTVVADVRDDCPSPGACSYGYPSIAQDPTDDTLWISYTHNRQTIGWVHVSERWILEKGDAFEAVAE
jgi:predicted neuraminidase